MKNKIKNKLENNLMSVLSIIVAVMLVSGLIVLIATKSEVTLLSFICVNIVAVCQTALIVTEENLIKQLRRDIGGADAKSR